MANPPYRVSVLTNGLTVITEERHHAPVTSFWMGYRVGSRNELPGQTGVSHWIEHMLFKPSERFPGTERDRLIAREGGTTNAFTWIDCTAYYTTIPSSKLDIVLQIEADRLSRPLFAPDVFETERSVILAERDAYENQPEWRLAEQVTATAFHAHPYGHEVIGLPEDIRNLSREDLLAYFRTYYIPNNAVCVVVGDFETRLLLGRLEELFSEIPPGATPPAPRAVEPAPVAERRVLLEGPGATGYLEMAFLAPKATDPRFVPSLVLGSILGSPISIGFGSGAESRSSRLYRALVERELAIDVDCNLEASIDPFLFDITAVVRDGRTHGEVEEAILRELEAIAASPPDAAEMAKVRKQLRALFAFTNERITHRAMVLTLGFTVFPVQFLDEFEQRVNDVTAEDVRAAAESLFTRRNRVVGWYQPLGGEDGPEDADEETETEEGIQ
ncbi:MAG: Protease 3 precursor [Candidatus Latescibacteria bacterium ADurb.Bin168]|nr:MAG: Protease 3 precursor [Candidatus Latescibacteria bacterium ADurb.Bin168]